MFQRLDKAGRPRGRLSTVSVRAALQQSRIVSFPVLVRQGSGCPGSTGRELKEA